MILDWDLTPLAVVTLSVAAVMLLCTWIYYYFFKENEK